MTGAVVLVVVLLAALALGLLRPRLDGRLRAADPDLVDLAALGVVPGERATLLLFSTVFCGPCRATRRVLAEVADMVDGVAWAEVDAEANLDAVRRLRVVRTPTVLVLDPAGRVVVRAGGQPRKADVIAAVGRAIPAPR